MLALKIDTSDLDRKLALMMEMPGLIEKAVVGAMSETVNDIHAAQIQEMKLSFDRPTPWLQKGLIKALPYGKDRQFGGKRLGQTLAQSGTYFEEFPVGRSPNDVVKPHVYGGSRRQKANEKRLMSIGALPQGGFAIMGREYPRNNYGNIPGSVYSKMLADLGTIPTAQAAKKNQGKAARFFVMTAEGSDAPTHIAERVGKNLRTVLVFTQSVNYQKRYQYHKVGKEQLAYSLPRHFDRILARYMNRL
jgi:hypothetical protein